MPDKVNNGGWLSCQVGSSTIFQLKDIMALCRTLNIGSRMKITVEKRSKSDQSRNDPCLVADPNYSHVYVISGLNTASISRYSLDSDTWEAKAVPDLHEARGWASACLLKDWLYVVGGHTSDGRTLNSIESINLQDELTQEWTLTNPDHRQLAARELCLVVALPSFDKIVILGGNNGKEQSLHDVVVLDTASMEFTRSTTSTSLDRRPEIAFDTGAMRNPPALVDAHRGQIVALIKH